MTRSVALVFPAWLEGGTRSGDDEEEGAYLSFERVVRTVASVAPLVEVDRLGCIVLASRGPSRYFGGDEALARHLYGLCSDIGVVRDRGGGCGVGIADSRFAAMAASHLSMSRGHPCVIDTAATADFIDALPVAALGRLAGVGADTVDLLGRLGLRTCGAVRGVGEVALIDRFGREGARVHQLIVGSDVKPLSPGAPPTDFAVAVDTDSPLFDSHHVTNLVQPVVADMLGSIGNHGLQCLRLLMVCHTDHAEESRRIWGEPHGFTTRGVVGRLACQLEGWLSRDGGPRGDDEVDAPTAGVTRVEIVPLECRETLVVQPLLWGGQQENTERAARAAALACAVDPSVRVSVPQWAGGRDLATVYSYVPVTQVDLADAEASERRVAHGDGVARDWSGSIPRPSPAFVLSEPRCIDVLDARGDQVGVTGRHELNSVPTEMLIDSRTYRILRVAGPWPVEERWWDPLRRRRHVRMQVLARNDRGNTGVLLVGLENHRWFLLARYD